MRQNIRSTMNLPGEKLKVTFFFFSLFFKKNSNSDFPLLSSRFIFLKKPKRKSMFGSSSSTARKPISKSTITDQVCANSSFVEVSLFSNKNDLLFFVKDFETIREWWRRRLRISLWSLWWTCEKNNFLFVLFLFVRWQINNRERKIKCETKYCSLYF